MRYPAIRGQSSNGDNTKRTNWLKQCCNEVESTEGIIQRYSVLTCDWLKLIEGNILDVLLIIAPRSNIAI